MYTTTSNNVEVSDEEAVKALVEGYYFTVEPTIGSGQIQFFADSKPNSAFEVYDTIDQTNPVTEEFFESLAEYLTDDFQVKCVEVEGDGEPAAWKWIVSPDGNVTNINI